MTTPLTRAAVTEIAERASKATRLPWTVVTRQDDRGNDEYYVTFGSQWDDSSLPDLPDAAFIAESRSDVPALCAMVLSLMDRVETLEKALEEISKPRYGLDFSDPEHEAEKYWTKLAIEYRRLAAAALAGKGESGG